MLLKWQLAPTCLSKYSHNNVVNIKPITTSTAGYSETLFQYKCKVSHFLSNRFLFPSSSFSPSEVSSYIIYVGRYQLNGLNSHQSTYRVSRVVIPSGYTEPNRGKDLALVQLSSPVTWSDYVRPVCLPASGTLFQGGMQCYVTGWGDIRDDGKTSSHHVNVCVTLLFSS